MGKKVKNKKPQQVQPPQQQRVPPQVSNRRNSSTSSITPVSADSFATATATNETKDQKPPAMLLEDDQVQAQEGNLGESLETVDLGVGEDFEEVTLTSDEKREVFEAELNKSAFPAILSREINSAHQEYDTLKMQHAHETINQICMTSFCKKMQEITPKFDADIKFMEDKIESNLELSPVDYDETLRKLNSMRGELLSCLALPEVTNEEAKSNDIIKSENYIKKSAGFVGRSIDSHNMRVAQMKEYAEAKKSAKDEASKFLNLTQDKIANLIQRVVTGSTSTKFFDKYEPIIKKLYGLQNDVEKIDKLYAADDLKREKVTALKQVLEL